MCYSFWFLYSSHVLLLDQFPSSLAHLLSWCKMRISVWGSVKSYQELPKWTIVHQHLLKRLWPIGYFALFHRDNPLVFNSASRGVLTTLKQKTAWPKVLELGTQISVSWRFVATCWTKHIQSMNQLWISSFKLFAIDAKFHKNALKFNEILTISTLQTKVTYWSS